MHDYDLAELVPASVWRRARTTAIALPVVENLLGLERDYLAMLRRMLRSVLNAIRDEIIPLARVEMAARRQIRDAIELSWFDRIEQLMGSLRRSIFGAQGMAREITWKIIERHTGHFLAAVRRTFRTDLSAVVRNEDALDYYEDVIARQEGEVKGWTDDLLNRVRRATTDAILNGRSVNELARDLQTQFDISDQRAKIIARDQVGKVTAELTEMRQRQGGISEYMWDTSKDERVRPRHARLQGVIYKWGEATGAEQGLPPGKPIMCRCRAKAIVRLKRR